MEDVAEENSCLARQRRRATIPLSNKSFDAIGLGSHMARGGRTRTSAGYGGVTGALTGGLLLLPSSLTPPMRRGSFLYRSSDSDSELSPMSLSRKLSATNEQPADDLLVTPFAQILQSLRSVRDNYMLLTKLPSSQSRRQSSMNIDETTEARKEQLKLLSSESEVHKMALETLEELEWCLDQLETIQTHRSVADMATNKFKRMLSRELNQFSETSKSANEVSEYICNTFLEKQQDIEIRVIDALDEDFNETEDAASDEVERCHTLDPTSDDKNDAVKAKPSPAVESTKASNSTAAAAASAAVPSVDVTDAATTAAATASATETNATIDPSTEIYGIAVSKDEELQLTEVLEGLDTWGMDIFYLSELTDNRSLTVITYTILKERDMLSTLKIPPMTLINYISRVELHYNQDNPYHNSIHAADVTQTTHFLLLLPALQNVFTDMELLAAILASAVHDVDHPGVSNQYLINSGLELALMYNDRSVLENHHLAVAFTLLRKEDSNVFHNLSSKSYQLIRRMIIDIVLATDMSTHLRLLADLKTMVETQRVVSNTGNRPPTTSASNSYCNLTLNLENYTDRMQNEKPEIMNNCQLSWNPDVIMLQGLLLQNHSQVLETLVHCADLANPTKPLHLYQQWTNRIMEEFFRQGDLERQNGLDVSPMCDRGVASVEKSQVGFIDYIVHPLWEAWAELIYPGCQEALDHLEYNRDWFEKAVKQKENGSATTEGQTTMQTNNSTPASAATTDQDVTSETRFHQ